MAITQNDTDEVFGSGGQLISSTPVVRDVTIIRNGQTLRDQAQQALISNRAYIASTPTQAQAVAQTKALSQQVNAIIRLLLNELDDTT